MLQEPKRDDSFLRRFFGEFLKPEQLRFLRFAIVGVSGVLVNELVLWLTQEYFLTGVTGKLIPWEGVAWNAKLAWGGFLGWAVSVLTNFVLNDRWTWGDRTKGRALHFLRRMFRYYLVASAAGLVQFGLLLVLTDQAGLHYLISNLVGIVAGLIINFVLNNIWTFRS